MSPLSIALAKEAGASAFAIYLAVTGEPLGKSLYESSQRAGMEAVVVCETAEEIKVAVEMGAGIVCVSSSEAVAVKASWRADLIPEGVCAVARLSSAGTGDLSEIEESWQLRDAGYQSVWAVACLHKASGDDAEHAGAVVQAMRSKASVKWASVKSMSGKGEGSKEYLGDLML